MITEVIEDKKWMMKWSTNKEDLSFLYEKIEQLTDSNPIFTFTKTGKKALPNFTNKDEIKEYSNAVI